MGRLLLVLQNEKAGFGSTTVALALFVSVSALVALCAKHGSRKSHAGRSNTLSSRTTTTKKNCNNKDIHSDPYKEIDDDEYVIRREETELERSSSSGGGEGGLWQKSIMMGDKCRPPEFSGVIYYDSHGNQLPEMPRSPRASPLQSFSFPLLS